MLDVFHGLFYYRRNYAKIHEGIYTKDYVQPFAYVRYPGAQHLIQYKGSTNKESFTLKNSVKIPKILLRSPASLKREDLLRYCAGVLSKPSAQLHPFIATLL